MFELSGCLEVFRVLAKSNSDKCKAFLFKKTEYLRKNVLIAGKSRLVSPLADVFLTEMNGSWEPVVVALMKRCG